MSTAAKKVAAGSVQHTLRARRVSTKEDSLARAKDFAEDWYLGLKGLSKSGQLKVGTTFKKPPSSFFTNTKLLPPVSVMQNT